MSKFNTWLGLAFRIQMPWPLESAELDDPCGVAHEEPKCIDPNTIKSLSPPLLPRLPRSTDISDFSCVKLWLHRRQFLNWRLHIQFQYLPNVYSESGIGPGQHRWIRQCITRGSTPSKPAPIMWPYCTEPFWAIIGKEFDDFSLVPGENLSTS